MAMSDRATRAKAAVDIVTTFFARIQATADDPDALDFTFGNPHELALPGLTAAIQAQVEPRSVDWFAYKIERDGRAGDDRGRPAHRARPRLRARRHRHDPGRLRCALARVRAAGGRGRRGRHPRARMVLLRAHAATPRTSSPSAPRSIPRRSISTSTRSLARSARARGSSSSTLRPTPTGRVYSQDTWQALADVLEQASRTHGRRIWLVSDEPYRRIRFDGIDFASPAGSYPWTVIDYSYGKVLLAPGQRLGYLALSPLIPPAERDELRAALMPLGLAIGWGFPDAVMQYSVPALESVSLDMAELARKRDRLFGALTDAGVRVTRPEGTFYLWGEAPRRRRGRLLRCPRRPRRLCDARHALRPAAPLPDVAHRHDGDDRPGAARSRRKSPRPSARQRPGRPRPSRGDGIHN